MQSLLLYLRRVKWSRVTQNPCLTTRLKLNGAGGRNCSLSYVIFWTCKSFSLAFGFQEHFLILSLTVAKQASSDQWSVSRDVLWQLLGTSLERWWHVPPLTLFGSYLPFFHLKHGCLWSCIVRTPVWYLWLVTVGCYWYPRPRTKEVSRHWYQEEEGCVEKDIHQESYFFIERIR